MNRAAIKRLTHGFAANRFAPEAPYVKAKMKPRIEKVAIIPKV